MTKEQGVCGCGGGDLCVCDQAEGAGPCPASVGEKVADKLATDKATRRCRKDPKSYPGIGGMPSRKDITQDSGFYG